MAVQKKETTIPATLTRFTASPINQQRKRRVAGYTHVSTDHDDQFTNYTAQVDYYTNYIDGRDDWEFVEVYTDATDTIGLKQNPTSGRRFSPISHLSGIFNIKRENATSKAKEEKLNMAWARRSLISASQ